MRLDLYELFEKVDIPENLKKPDKKMVVDEESLSKNISKKTDKYFKKANYLSKEKIFVLAAAAIIIAAIGLMGRNNFIKDDISNRKNQNIADKTKPKDNTDENTNINKESDNTNSDNTNSDNSVDGINNKDEREKQDSLENKGNVAKRASNIGPNIDSEKNVQLELAEKASESLGSYEDINFDREILEKNGWKTDSAIKSQNITLPKSLEYNGDMSREQFDYAFLNNLSKDSGYDYSAYAGQSLREVSIELKPGQFEYEEERQLTAKVLKAGGDETVGMYIQAPQNIVNSVSVYNRDIYEILGDDAEKWVDYYEEE